MEGAHALGFGILFVSGSSGPSICIVLHPCRTVPESFKFQGFATLLSLSVRLYREKLDKERLKALGMGAFASYGVISNLNYGTALT
jgi:hypothetical protein